MSNEKEHLLAVIVSYVPASNTKGSRVKLSLPRFKKSKAIPFDHTYTLSYQIAEAFLASRQVEVKAEADLGDKHLLLVDWKFQHQLLAIFNI